MSRRAAARLTAVLLLALVPAAVPAGADTLLTLKSHQDAHQMAGQDVPAQDSTVELWIGDGRVSRSDDNGKLVMQGDSLTFVNAAAKTYSTIELPIDLAALLPEGMEEMAEMWKMRGEVTASDERREIGGWKTRLYTIDLTNAMGLAISTRMWTTTDLELDYDAYRELAAQMLAMQPGGADLADDLMKIEGFPVLQETTIDMGGTTVTSREELVSAEEKTAPAGTYEVPEGFEETELPGLGGPGGP